MDKEEKGQTERKKMNRWRGRRDKREAETVSDPERQKGSRDSQ